MSMDGSGFVPQYTPSAFDRGWSRHLFPHVVDVFTCPPLDGRTMFGSVLVDGDGMVKHVSMRNDRCEGE